MEEKSTWRQALQDENIRKNITYNITRRGTTKTVDAIYQNPDFANCRTGDKKKDRESIRSAIQTCNPKNRDRFNRQKYGAAELDALSDEYQVMAIEKLPNLDKVLERMQMIDDMAAEADNVEDLKLLKLKQQIHDKHRSALSSLADTAQLHRRLIKESDGDSAQSRLNRADSGERLPEAPKSLRGNAAPGSDSE